MGKAKRAHQHRGRWARRCAPLPILQIGLLQSALVIPAQAGIQFCGTWTPACAGVTNGV